MKKSFLLVGIMAWGVTASAYAANPFADVPAGHWAYDSVAKLAAAGVIDGYGDATFGGDKLMTRYEMAQIVAKAMAKGANVDKLAAEFDDELDTLGVRVANLEKNADNVKITGEVRYSYANYRGDIKDRATSYFYVPKDTSAAKLRSRIWVSGQINDDWSYTGMLENTQNISNNIGDETISFKRAYVTGKVGGTQVVAGRQNLYLVNGNVYDAPADALLISYGKDVKLSAFAAKPTDIQNVWVDHGQYKNMYGAYVDAKIGVVDATAGYTVLTESQYIPTIYEPEVEKNEIFNAGVQFDVAKNLHFTADYMNVTDSSYVLALDYKGAQAVQPGSYGLYAKYYDQEFNTALAHTMNGFTGDTGFKGFMVGANYTFAKNIIGAVEYYDMRCKVYEYATEKDMRTLWSEVTFTF